MVDKYLSCQPILPDAAASSAREPALDDAAEQLYRSLNGLDIIDPVNRATAFFSLWLDGYVDANAREQVTHALAEHFRCGAWRSIETAEDRDEGILIGAFYASGRWDVQVGYRQRHNPLRQWRPFVGQTGQPTHWMPLPDAPRSGREATPSRSTEDTTNNAADSTPDVPASLRTEEGV